MQAMEGDEYVVTCCCSHILSSDSAGSVAQSTRGAAAVPAGSLSSRLATLERSMSAAKKLTHGASGTTTSNAAVLVLPSSRAGGPTSSSSAESDVADKVAALEAQLSQLRQPETISSLRSIKSLGIGSNLSSAGGNPAQLMHSDSAVREQLSQLQEQIEALMSGKANKADLDSLQLHAAILGDGSSGGAVAEGNSNLHGSAATDSGHPSSGAISKPCLLQLKNKASKKKKQAQNKKQFKQQIQLLLHWRPAA